MESECSKPNVILDMQYTVKDVQGVFYELYELFFCLIFYLIVLE
jgi:hypothetical protein